MQAAEECGGVDWLEDRPRPGQVDRYNASTRVRLLAAICLEGARCGAEQDRARCRVLHRECNTHTDTTQLSFASRVAVSECRVEELLCQLDRPGHSPVHCCNTRYQQCVDRLQTLQTKARLITCPVRPYFNIFKSINSTKQNLISL